MWTKEQKREYQKKWEEKNPLLVKKYKKKYMKKWREKNPLRIKEIWKRAHSKRQFGGNRLKVLERDNYTCQTCGRTHHEARLLVHHADGTGRGKKVHNNNISNLVTLCRGCHASLHRKGKKCSEETRRRMSETRRRNWEAKKLAVTQL